MEPAIAVPIAFFVCASIVALVRSRIGEAIADRIRGQGRGDDESRVELERLRVELDGVRHELGEVSERLDFTERLLAQTRDMDRLAKPR